MNRIEMIATLSLMGWEPCMSDESGIDTFCMNGIVHLDNRNAFFQDGDEAVPNPWLRSNYVPSAWWVLRDSFLKHALEMINDQR